MSEEKIPCNQLSLRETLICYAGSVWSWTDLIELRPLPPHLGERRWITPVQLMELEAELTAWNQQGANLYAGVLPRLRAGGSDEDAGPGRCLWADFDKVDPRTAWTRAVKEKGLPKPTMIVNSGHGTHAFWTLAEPHEPGLLCAAVGDLAVLLGSDPAVRNPSRVMRLPGFINHKPPSARCELLHVDPEHRYSFAELRALIPKPQPAQPAPMVPQPVPGTEVVERARRYVATIPGARQGGRNSAAFKAAAALANDFSLSEAEALPILVGWDRVANVPPLGERELGRILDSARRYAKKPAGEKAVFRRRQATPEAVIQAPPELRLPEELKAEARGERQTISLPWPRLGDATRLLRPGSVAVIGGPPGDGKSLLAMQICIHVHDQGVPWAYLPLEDSRADFERRLLAHLAETWSVLNDRPETASERQRLLQFHEAKLSALAAHVCENPRRAVMGPNGKPTTPALPYAQVVDWLEETIGQARVVVIDPFAQIDFGDREPWTGERDFIRRVCGLAAHAEASVILVCHTRKRSGRDRALPLSGEDLQGAAELRRLVHTVLLLDAHDRKESAVWRTGGQRLSVEHGYTILVDKARYGNGRGALLAFTLDGPRLSELGTIAPAERKGKDAPEPDFWTFREKAMSEANQGEREPETAPTGEPDCFDVAVLGWDK